MRTIREMMCNPKALFWIFALVVFCGAFVCCEKEEGDDDDAGDDDDTYELTEGFVLIPHGTFKMGSPPDELGRRQDEAQHEVILTHDIEMMATEVTQAEFEEIMGYNPSFFPILGSKPKRPVEQVSWFDALAYSIKLSELFGYKPCYVLSNIKCADGTSDEAPDYCKNHGGIFSADVSLNGVESVYECEGFRLPTEAEWEYAARAGTTTAFYNGGITFTACSPRDPNVDEIAWYCANSFGRTHDVGYKRPNAWGLYDMIGNVSEWVWDWYASKYPEKATDPQGPDNGHFRVVRGCSVKYDGASRCRSAYRKGHTPNFRTRYVGFRLVRTLSKSDLEESRGALNSPAPAMENKQEVASDAMNSKIVQVVYPKSLPFEFKRPDVGKPLSKDEIDEFTRKITGFYKQINYFHWLLWHSHGMAENDEGMPDYKLFWQDVKAIKDGDVVTFEHRGYADNLTIRMSKSLNNAIAGYLMSGDKAMGRVTEQYCKGLVALSRGLMWTDNDPEPYLLARAIFTQNHCYVEDGRQACVNYDPVKDEEVYDWNAHTIPNPVNPYWGDIWVRNMRSKDDVPHIYRAVPLVARVAEEGEDENVREACKLALEYLQGFARDIVDSGYYIRTKDKYGNQFVPLDDSGLVNDLASFVNYEPIVPGAECNPKLASALIAYGNPLDIYCGDGYGPNLYETVATQSHYYNYEIIRYFHVAAITNALMVGQNDVAQILLSGLARRVDDMMQGVGNWENYPEWDSDVAAYLLVAATAGLPLTSEEARKIQEQYSLAVDWYQTFPNFDLWSPSVPNGELSYYPSRWSPSGPVVDFEDMIYFIEYCYSPFRNKSGAEVVNCDIVADPEQWGK